MTRHLTRRSLAAAALLLLTACSGSSPGLRASDEDGAGRATLSTQGGGDEPAKLLFGAVAGPSSQAAAPVGSYARGCQAGAVQLAQTGPTWQAMRLSRNRHWAQPATVAFVEDLSRFAATLPGWAGLYVGDLSQPRGGPMPSGHTSHQSGLDADIWMRPGASMALSAAEREAIPFVDTQTGDGAYVGPNWTPAHAALIRRAAEDPRVARIFLFAGGKAELCRTATGDRSWLAKVRPWWGHSEHFHVRLACPVGAATCASQDPVPLGDGCADAAAWVQGILNPPPPDPTPAPPRADLTLDDLPAQCASVLAAD